MMRRFCSSYKKCAAVTQKLCSFLRSHPAPVTWSLLLFLTLCGIGVWSASYGAHLSAIHAKATATFHAKNAALEYQQMLSATFSVVRALASLVNHDPQYGVVSTLFNATAGALLQLVPVNAVQTLELIPSGVIRLVHPHASGNDELLGMDLFGVPDPGFVDSVRDGVQHPQLSVQGPMPPLSGTAFTGPVLVVRQSVFAPASSDAETFGRPDEPNPVCGPVCGYNATSGTKFWGMAAAVILMDALTSSPAGDGQVASPLRTLVHMGYRYEMVAPAVGVPPGAPARVVVEASDSPPAANKELVEVSAQLPGVQWTLRVGPDGGSWMPGWYGGALAAGVVASLLAALLLFRLLVSRRKSQMLLETLLPAELIQDLQAGDLKTLRDRRDLQSECPAELMLDLLGSLLEGQPPELRDVVLLRTVLCRQMDVYRPFNLGGQIREANLDADVARALMRQLGDSGLSLQADAAAAVAAAGDLDAPSFSEAGELRTSRSVGSCADFADMMLPKTTESQILKGALLSILYGFQPRDAGGCPSPGLVCWALDDREGVPPESGAVLGSPPMAALKAGALAGISGGTPRTVPGALLPGRDPADGSPLDGAGTVTQKQPNVWKPQPPGSKKSRLWSAASLFVKGGVHPTTAGVPTGHESSALELCLATAPGPCKSPAPVVPAGRGSASVRCSSAVSTRSVTRTVAVCTTGLAPRAPASLQGDGRPAGTWEAVDGGDDAGFDGDGDDYGCQLDSVLGLPGQAPDDEQQAGLLLSRPSMVSAALPPCSPGQQRPALEMLGMLQQANLSAPPAASTSAPADEPGGAGCGTGAGGGASRTGGVKSAGTQRGVSRARAQSAFRKPGPPKPLMEEVERLLSLSEGWQFDTWGLQEASGGHALSCLGFYLLQRAGLLERFRLEPLRVARLLRQIEAGYHATNPYHNAVHAADVTRTLHVLLRGARMTAHYVDHIGLLACYFAALVHDFGHPGLTNDFLIASGHPLALRYNDRSPLESHHAASAFTLLSDRPDLDILAGLSRAERAAFRKQVVEMVIATDMKQHFTILKHFTTVHHLRKKEKSTVRHQLTGQQQQLLQQQVTEDLQATLSKVPSQLPRLNSGKPSSNPAAGPVGSIGSGSDAAAASTTNTNAAAAAAAAPVPIDEAECLLSLQMALKVADIGHLGAELEAHQRWLGALEEEFFRQGDQERDLGLPISPLFDRSKQGVSKSQVGFFDFVALPLVREVVDAFPGAGPLLDCFTANYDHWHRVEAETARKSVGDPPSVAEGAEKQPAK